MADALISSITNELTRIISSRIQQEYQLVVGVTEEINKLNSSFLAIQAVLEDAEWRQTKEAAAKNWLEKLKQVSYDMDDLLDDWNTAILKWENEEDTSLVAAKPKTTFCSVASCSPFSRLVVSGFNQVRVRRGIAHKIKDICKRLDEIDKEKTSYSFNVYRATVEDPERPITTSRVDVSRVRGRDGDQKSLLHKLLCDSTQLAAREVVVVSIVGAGGIGKTTLAQLAYNDDEVKVHFEKRIWICVSEPFSKVRIAKELIQALDTSRSYKELSQLDLLLNTISDLIVGKRFLLVLDDVWNEDHSEWEPLKLSLGRGAPGSRILVTTRKHNVAKMMETTHCLSIPLLLEEECWHLFRQLAFCGRSEGSCERLVEIGKEIARKAKGLPLAAKVLGGLMQFKRSKEQWDNVLSSNLWELEEVEKGLFGPLLLSYYDLPPAIRRCFTYCALFPKDFTMVKGDVIKMWMAQGYLVATSNKEMELVGEEYVDNLVVRSFFQDVKAYTDGGGMEFKMHDIVHDFAQFLSGNESFQCRGRMDSSFYHRTRHACLQSPSIIDLESISSAKSLRSLFIMADNYPRPKVIVEALPKLLHNLKYLRSLHLCLYSIRKIPDEVGELTHLRYLNLNGCPSLAVLPETISNLCNLESLSLYGCRMLYTLPYEMQKLIKLRHLSVSDNMFLSEGIGRLTSLRTLNHLNVSLLSDTDYGFRIPAGLCVLEDLNQLEGKLSIHGLEYVGDVRKAVKAQLKMKKGLTSLELRFGWWGLGLLNDYAVLEALEPPSELEVLCIKKYRGDLFPNWMISLTKLMELKLHGRTTSVDLIDFARLPSLERLTLMEVSIKSNKADLAGTASLVAIFPRLKELQIYTMPESEELDIAAAEMPLLEEFQIMWCKKMKDLPDCILTAPKLQNLSICGCPILAEDYRRESGKYWHKISHISRIYISP